MQSGTHPICEFEFAVCCCFPIFLIQKYLLLYIKMLFLILIMRNTVYYSLTKI